KTYRWMKEHAHYDDQHPKTALEIVERYATTERVQTRVMFAAKRSLELLDHALITSYRAFSTASASSGTLERSSNDRRKTHASIAFPDRRFGERRGSRIAA